MSCQKIKELFSTREDARTLPEVIRHAAECSSCKDFLAAEERMNRGFRVLTRIPPAIDLTGTVLGKLKTGAGKTAETTTGAGSGLPPFLLLGAAAVIGIASLIGISLFSGESREPDSNGTSSRSRPLVLEERSFGEGRGALLGSAPGQLSHRGSSSAAIGFTPPIPASSAFLNVPVQAPDGPPANE